MLYILFIFGCCFILDSSIGVTANAQTVNRSPIEESTISVDEQTIYFEGTVSWGPEGNNDYLPSLCGNTVVVCEGDDIICSGIIDDKGDFSFSLNSTYELWDGEPFVAVIKVVAGDGNIKVCVPNGDIYGGDECLKNVKPGDAITDLNLVVPNITNVNETFQISQALFIARDYAMEMMSTEIDPVAVLYPAGHNYYDFQNTIIHMQRKGGSEPLGSHALWDTLMHEYGHHIQCQMGMIYKNINYDHSLIENCLDEPTTKTKEQGIKTAWIEGWATMFCLQVQDYYCGLVDFPYLDPVNYGLNNRNKNYNVESELSQFGEGGESSIIAVLWDLYDSANEEKDTITLSHQAFWNITTKDIDETTETYDPILTFSDFIAEFYEAYPQYVDDIGANLTYYKMASSQPEIINFDSVSESVSPTFQWEAQGGSTRYPNNKFQLIFYNSAGVKVLTTTSMDTTYTLSESEWKSLLENVGEKYAVAVASTQTGEPETGKYISQRLETYTLKTVKIPIEINMVTLYNSTGDYYQFNEDSNYLTEEEGVIGFAGDYYYYVYCNIDEMSDREISECTLYISVEGADNYCWLLSADKTMIDACANNDGILTVPFTEIYNSETGEFYLYPTTGNTNMLIITDLHAELEIIYGD